MELVFKPKKVKRNYDEYIYSMLMLSYCLSSSVMPHSLLRSLPIPILFMSFPLLKLINSSNTLRF
ncbi:hypothetical protein VHARVF571_510128 [Vibrio harveyi]|nr:hypothetical protein VHARVF571_510128 [Vibrio harveyi]